eukprot:TRINITY_DN626_c1_g1_i1.p2 TRINITY_DN626_c1_g1~~TRINITY_DN626_c1_g1_i1.p2  ORF type:complete len:416 (+),score=18.38 TRINITY_DN626_c1_g1_i1:199-1446(+)
MSRSLNDSQDLQNICKRINKKSPIQLNQMLGECDLAQIRAYACNLAELKPSGPRKGDDGTANIKQGLAHATISKEGGLVLMITLLAAGFVVGPSGKTIKYICSKTGVRSKSWYTNAANYTREDLSDDQYLRVFYMEGSTESLIEIVNIIMAAVQRYNELVDGKYKDKVVTKRQFVCGIEFEYKPPPIHTIPVAARTIKFQGMKPSEYGRKKALSKQAAKVETNIESQEEAKQCEPYSAGQNSVCENANVVDWSTDRESENQDLFVSPFNEMSTAALQIAHQPTDDYPVYASDPPSPMSPVNRFNSCTMFEEDTSPYPVPSQMHCPYTPLSRAHTTGAIPLHTLAYTPTPNLTHAFSHTTAVSPPSSNCCYCVSQPLCTYNTPYIQVPQVQTAYTYYPPAHIYSQYHGVGYPLHIL